MAENDTVNWREILGPVGASEKTKILDELRESKRKDLTKEELLEVADSYQKLTLRVDKTEEKRDYLASAAFNYERAHELKRALNMYQGLLHTEQDDGQKFQYVFPIIRINKVAGKKKQAKTIAKVALDNKYFGNESEKRHLQNIVRY